MARATEIAQRLYVSMGTVKTHIGRLLTKLGARDRAQLVIAAYDAGLVRRELRRDGGHTAQQDRNENADPERVRSSALPRPMAHAGR
jgi:Bacterial regulatory proteins, luxR family